MSLTSKMKKISIHASKIMMILLEVKTALMMMNIIKRWCKMIDLISLIIKTAFNALSVINHSLSSILSIDIYVRSTTTLIARH
jgi:hypothetical protein